MLDFTETTIEQVYGAFVGIHDENPVKVNPDPLHVNELTESLFLAKMQKGFSKTEKWFTINTERQENSTLIMEAVTDIMEGRKPSQAMESLAIRLNYCIDNLAPATMRRPGEFIVVVMHDISYFGALTTGVLVMKVNNKELHLNITSNPLALTDSNIIPAKFQLAGLFIDTGGEFKVASIDTVTKRGQRSVWEDDFLTITPDKDNYYYTEQWMNLVAQFAQKSGASLGYNPADKADFKRRSLQYFQDATAFDQVTYEDLLFDTPAAKGKFSDYVAKYQVDGNVNLLEDFEIVNAAVKNNALLLKASITLDSNFKIHLDGRRDMIEDGFDEGKGKKFMKLYYDFAN